MAVFDELKTIAKVLQEAGKIELYEKILAILQQLLEMQEKIRTQDEEIRELKDKLKIKASLVKENNAYWIKTKDDTKDGPYCTRCQEKDGVLISLHPVLGRQSEWLCPECKNYVNSVQHSKYINSGPMIIPRDDNVPTY